ncbi:MAG TPA: hypothetical protein VGR14_17155 [Verrucomicrobiae bacterium]|jgi:hypothetical protein|nr:hypothetical protein [Verrucomicrobiae bacterium]
MSMLNDALKRASQSDRSRARPAEPVQPRVVVQPAVVRRGQTLAMALVAGSVFALGLAVWFFWQLWSTSHSPAPAHFESVAELAPKPAPPPAIHTEVPPPSALTVSPPQVAEQTPAPTPEPAIAVEPAWPAELKLSGIFFRQTNPLALINGKTVGVGDEIKGIRITKIESDRVTVEWNGKAKELLVKGRGV